MAEYYAVERSPEYLAHYGIKGMKWGVRKAIESGNSRRLDRHWKKAQKKLAKLNKNTDVEAQKKEQIKYAKRAAIGLGIGSLGTGGIFAANAFGENARKRLDAARKDFYHGPRTGGLFDRPAEYLNNYEDTLKNESYKIGRAEKYKKAAAIIDLAGFGYGGYAGARSLAAKYKQTPKGHAAAVAKRNQFQKEMNKAFAGTKYGKKKRRR